MYYPYLLPCDIIFDQAYLCPQQLLSATVWSYSLSSRNYHVKSGIGSALGELEIINSANAGCPIKINNRVQRVGGTKYSICNPLIRESKYLWPQFLAPHRPNVLIIYG